MIDPEEQLRRLAEGRAAAVEPFVPEQPDAQIIPFLARRWPVSIAAALLAIAAASAGAFAAFGGSNSPASDEFAQGAESALSETTSTLFADLVIPDVVGETAEDALAELQEAGFDAEFDVLFVEEDDERAGLVTEVIPPEDLEVPGSNTVTVVVARLAPSRLAQNPCDRPAHTLGDLDGDGELSLDSIFPRWSDGVLREIEVCTASGQRSSVSGLALGAISHVGDIDLDGLDEIIVSEASVADPEGEQSHLFSLGGAETSELVKVDAALRIGPRDDGTNDWWGCFAFSNSSSSAERFARGTWWDGPDGGIEYRLIETFIVDGVFVDGEIRGGTADNAIPGRRACRPDPNLAACASSDLRVSLIGDVDGDGTNDLVAPRDDLVCLSSGVIAPIGAAAADAEVWFFDDIDDDGRLEVFIGQTTADSMRVQPWSVDADGEFTLATELDDCCVQEVPQIDTPDVWRSWFSCVAAAGDRPAGLVGGRYEISDSRLVRWTIDFGPGSTVDDEVTYEVSVSGLPTDAWMPGNGCRSGSNVWRESATLVFDDDGATAASIDAFNVSIDGDDIDRRFAQVREALRIGEQLQAVSNYEEDSTEGLLILSGLRDDSVAAERFIIVFTDDGQQLASIEKSWTCQPGRGHEDFSRELCI